jgi:hypothetical protein
MIEMEEFTIIEIQGKKGIQLNGIMLDITYVVKLLNEYKPIYDSCKRIIDLLLY